MSDQCDYIEQCPIVKYFNEQSWDMMLKRYCLGDFHKCYRFQRRQKGEPVAEHNMPWDGSTEINHL